MLGPCAPHSEDKEELLLLTTNVFIKDLQNLSGECLIPIMALTCMSELMNTELASILYREILQLFSCSNSTIRKKVCALSLKLFLCASQNDEVMDEIQPLLCDRLKDKDQGV